ncbi:MAG: hypothetical protein IT581_10615 [Verrucomicrobiales bacterium]|nr:hypothetical protein [Verrucomicrobiales bacterium]
MKKKRYSWLAGLVTGACSATLLATAASPPLSAQKTADGRVQLKWPSDAVGFSLEAADGLVPPVQWRVVSEAIVNEGGTSSVTLQPSAPTRFYRLRGGASLTTVTETSPAAGESDVAVTRETIFHLSAPLDVGVTLTSDHLFAEFGGRRLLARAELSGDRRTLTLFYLENLPSGGRIEVRLVGDGLRDDLGQDLDADGNGQPGGTLDLRFATAGTTGLPGTAVIGHVLTSERKPDGSNQPLEGVIVTVDGAEESLRALTDANGFFTLQPAPAGRFFVHVDGRTAIGSQWPGGAYYPFIGKAWEAVAGRSNNLAAGTGQIFLPLIQADALKPVSATEETKINFSPSVLSTNPALTGVELRVPPNSLFSENGTRGGKIGIAPVPPDRLPEPLPPGLNLPLVITIQTDGPQNFDRPVPVRFPNLPDPVTGVKLPPGAKTELWSFNHDTGRWEPQGTATISADGNFAETDPGVGVRQPGWHGVSPGTRGRRHRGGESPRLPGQPPGYGRPPRPDDPPQPPCDPGFHYSYDCDKDGCPDHFQACDCDKERDEYHRILGYCRYDKIFRNAVSQITCSFDNSCPDPAWAKKWITCRRELNEALATWRACKARLGLDSVASGRGQVTLQSPSPSADDQERLADAGAAIINLVLGAPAWTDLDPGLPDSSFDTVVALGNALAESSPGGRTITLEEQALVANSSRPPNITPAMVQTAIQRLNALQAGTLPIAERQQIEQASATYTTMFADLKAQGWKTSLDGLYLQEAETSTAAARLAWESFIDGRRQFYVIRNLENGFEQRGRLNESGEFENIILPTDSYMRIEYLDPVTLAAGSAVFRSARAGFESQIPVAPMLGATGGDADGDGVADSLESIVGTAPNLADTDGDGVSDGEELRNESNPLDGQPSALGVIAGLNLPGSALAVGVQNEVAVVGMGTGSGVAFVDVQQPTEPVLIAVSKTPGLSTGVAFTGSFAAVAAGTSGVALFDLSDRTQPRFLRQISGDARAITASGGRLYFGSSTTLNIVPTDGTWPTTVTLPEALDDLQAFDGFLYVLTKAQLRVYAIDGRNLVPRGSVLVAGTAAPLESGRKLFVGSRFAYVGTFDGWRVVDVGNPDAPVVVGQTSRTQSAVHDLVFDGRQLLAITSFAGPATLAASVYDGTNPTRVTNVLTTFDTPGAARAVALHRGYGLVADTEGGLTVVNYLARDRGTNPPSVTGFVVVHPVRRHRFSRRNRRGRERPV